MPGTWRRWSALTEVERVGLYTRQSLYFVLVGFNVSALLRAALELDAEGGEVAALVAGGAVITVLGLATVVSVFRRLGTAHPLPWRPVAALLAAGAVYLTVAVAAWSADARGAAAVTLVASVTLPLALVPGRRIAIVLVAFAAVLTAIAGGAVLSAIAGLLFAAGLVFTARVSMWVLGIVSELDNARQVQSQLAVANERLRFSRDVHDVLGRRLSTIAVQAELAATLARRGDEHAADRMLEVRGVAHEALREARELARGYRSTDFVKELDGARSLLRSAGIDVRLSVDAMPRAWHEAAGWIVRESVTNVLRHSSASVVEVTFAGGRLRVENDGAHPGDAVDGSGLRSLRERLAPLGASLVAHPGDGDRWIVVAHLPGTGPLSATHHAGADR